MSSPNKPPSGLATSSSWNSEGFAFAPNTNTLDRESMPSEKAEAARQKSAEVMAALKSGEPGAADRAMGAQKESGSKGILPLGWLKGKIGGGKKKEGKGEGKGKVGGDDGNGSIMSGTTLGDGGDPTIKKM